ncbi:hypothetical protein HGRIS_008263 [Hohenbuehelia grisea]|uniref:Nucleoporin Pom152 n=1 Tax=Hohenbuehelia grisea TaxID=104357 RepID=A0ABR3J8B4_9AGAR
MATPKKPPAPVIPENYLDVPSQRLYYLSIGLLCQAIKIMDFGWHILSAADDSLRTCSKWLLFDFLYCVVLWFLRIPRLNYSLAVVMLQVASLWFLDGLMFGGVTLNLGGTRLELRGSIFGRSNRPDLVTTPEPFNLIDIVAPYTFGILSPAVGKDAHLLGQHTVRMSPISTAQLYPNGQTFCLAPPTNSVLVPILLNNTNPSEITLSLTPLGGTTSKNDRVEVIRLSSKDLKAMEKSRLEALQAARPNPVTKYDSDDYDDYDDDDEDTSHGPHSNLQKTQTVVHVKVTKPGTLRLERVIDFGNVEARIMYPSETKVAPCPFAAFINDDVERDRIRCAGQDPGLKLMIDIKGVTPLSLRWSKSLNGVREPFLVEGIEGEHAPDDDSHLQNDDPSRSKQVVLRRERVQDIKVPLTLTLDALGTHSYNLEEVVDALGNVISLSSSTDSSPRAGKASRSFTILRRPSVSFTNCPLGRSKPMLDGSVVPLQVSVSDADAEDGPWDISVRYQPTTEGAPQLESHVWDRTTAPDSRKIELKANAPGEYTISGIKGRHCEGIVLSPEICRVAKRPRPTAEVEWKFKHECSGDTGVTALFVFHGTPPFVIRYEVQRDNERPEPRQQTFATARGEMSIQPDRSGHYVYRVVSLNDQYYKNIPVGATYDQVVHPLATAGFVSDSSTGGRSPRGKGRIINTCEGQTVSVDVDIRGTAPYNLELRVVDPKGSKPLYFKDLTTHRTKLDIPIPAIVDKEGGSFDIELVRVTDSYNCAQDLSAPAVSVNVRRIKPTVKFYGDEDERHVTVLEQERASLPLRLSGEGPWRVRYQRVEDGRQLQTLLRSPNDRLEVTQKGVYELLGVADSQCPGTVLESKTYKVQWIPRPFAKLSPRTLATYEPYNNSHILPPICEGLNDHVDLELTGRPPFQIMYNVAQGTETGGTKLLDQPTFNSIQPQTRFQLQTSRPGRMFYEVKQIGDSAYPLAKHKNAVIPRAERLLFEQQVAMRPSAAFKTQTRLSYCLNEPFVPTSSSPGSGVVVFEGVPPFELKLSIKSIGTSQIAFETVEVWSKVWEVSLPSYSFSTVGPHRVTIESVVDASKCQQANLDPMSTSIWVDVAETATIVPFDRREHYCVGEVSQFQLEGIPPWSIGYKINGRTYVQEAKTSPFSLLHQQPGEFSITSIAHRQQQCKASVTEMSFTVHPLPSAQVGHGKRVYQDIHEGDQAEIVFTLFGEPPFTFTYQRAELSTKKGKPGKILETHTVSRVHEHTYSVFSAMEGTWTVTSISDRYCRYPQGQPDVVSERRRS